MIQQDYRCDGPESHEVTAPRADDAKQAADSKDNRAGKPCPVGWCHGRLWARGDGSVAMNAAGNARLAKNRARTAHLHKTEAVFA